MTSNKKVKAIVAVSSVCALAMSAFAACSTDKSNEKPEIVGAGDFNCVVGQPIDLLSRVAALDKEDGDLTPKMTISISPEVEVKDGVVVFPEADTYVITYSVKDSDGNTTTVKTYVDTFERTVFKSFDLIDMNGFSIDVGGSAKLATQSVVGDGGKSHLLFKATGAKADADVALTRTYELAGGKEYTFKYTVKSNVAGTAKVKIGNADPIELTVAEGDNDLTFTHDLTESEEESVNVKVQLLLGGLGEDIDVDFAKATVAHPKEVDPDAGDVVTIEFTNDTVKDRIDNDEGKSTLAGSVSIAEDKKSATLDITTVCSYGDMWRGGMFINTGVSMTVGSTYDISFDLQSANDGEYEVCMLNSQWGPDEFIDIIPDINKNGTTTYALTVPENKAGTLWLYIRSGTNVNTITISDLKIKLPAVAQTSFTPEFTSDTVKDRIDNDEGKSTLAGSVSIAEDKKSATLDITTVCSYGDMWRGGMFINTGVPMSVGDKFDISFKLQSANEGEYEVCMLNSQWGPDEFIDIIPDINKNGTTTYTLTVPDNKAGTLWLYIRSGTNVNTITISELKIELDVGETPSQPMVTETYGVTNLFQMYTNKDEPNFKWVDGKLVLEVARFGTEDWHTKIQGYAFGMNACDFGDYFVSFKAKATAPVFMRCVGPREEGWDPNVIWTQFNLSETETVYNIKSNEIPLGGDNHLEWQFGFAANAEYENVTIEISEIAVYYKSMYE